MADERRSMAVLVGSKQLARIHGDDAPNASRKYCYLCRRETTTWLPMRVTRWMPQAWSQLSRLGQEDSTL